jgi:hypothetical protein
VNCGPRKAPIAKTIACITITQRWLVANAIARTNVVITALKRGPRASITLLVSLFISNVCIDEE